MKLHLSTFLFLLSAATKASLFADAQGAEFCQSLHSYDYNSGATKAASTVISIDKAPWIQLDLSGSELATGATIKITGDKTAQVINADALSSNDFSAIFDGSSVSVELSSPGNVRGGTSRVVVSNVNVGLCKVDNTAKSICGDADDRIPSTDVRMGRYGGCTAWLISEDAFITAGHCGPPTSSTRIHFVFGTGSAASEDQYSVDVSTFQRVNGGFGNDWGAGRFLPNSTTGKLPGVAQSEKCESPGCGWFNLGTVPSATFGNNIRITGYGTADVDSRSQKTHVGALTTIKSTYLRYVPDTTGGNSGSPVIHEETGNAIGIHTHGGCSSSGGSNTGTRIDIQALADHVDFLLGNPPPTTPPTPNPTVPVTPPPTSGDNAVAQEAVYDTGYEVPRCANEGSSCDSGLFLLKGKGSMVNGQEPNASNTNKFGQACNDGNSGSYHSDESIDQITVTAGDLDTSGNPVPSGDFIVEGGRAYVTVKLWCWASGASDHADLYLSSDASSSSPNWQTLTTITCPGGGAQTIRHAFDVPSGTDQSIRVNFRYRGSPSTCSNGGYDDHDDLVFAVKSGPSGPQTASYDAGLEAPKCSYGSSCDSVGLLNGRGTINDGNESNTPNTVNECSDGAYGTYHSDESIDKIVVSRTDGGSDDFTEGDEVTITATVWCWSSGSSDYIDFYYAQNANSPAWMTIGVREKCPGGQLQTVSRTFVLQSGGLQAVRVNLMYGNGNAGTNKCTSGNYDDTDDLVISVRSNAMAASMEISSKEERRDDVQHAIAEVEHDKRADDAAAALVELNGSIRAGDADDGSSSSEKSKKSKSDKEAVVSANAVSATAKYVCEKHKPFAPVICANGVESDDKCSYQGQSCGRKGKKCHFAECAGEEDTD